ncbi:hypothetical protein [Sulfurimonas sp. RIFOXYB12_FULL_35_9]|uniref:hypothetical protein n=1 Tax=Sulfurimonas sp. RIFOXYB12_FULL_35_9 TaxID=1802256 RepID=UPI0008AC931E|nr:hypothetical protein [Sulfurimonas sp. RIFOXYB12_FULL_35_9]OHE03352.1 MAG: hypothetical protein A2345_07075 [Sulfurimonas sp. RIFOXYB12_FULL_35_9]
MIKYLLIFILPLALYASKILSYNIYDRTDRVDVMITFDTPYDGVIKQRVGDSSISIKLQNASIESSKIKQLTSKYIKSITITPMQDYTEIVAEVPPSVTLQASKTSDAYGLRLRFATTSLPTANAQETKEAQAPSLNSLPTKKDDDISASYYIVVTILILGIITLFYIKKRVSAAQNKKEPSSWLFKGDKESPNNEQIIENFNLDNKNVSIRFQKPLDGENSVVMLDFGDQSYLVLMGKGNIILDKFTDNRPASQDDFNTILQSRHHELERFLSSDTKIKEPLQTYKEKAASILYEA